MVYKIAKMLLTSNFVGIRNVAKRTYSVRYIAGQPAKRIQPMPVHMLGESLPVGLPYLRREKP